MNLKTQTWCATIVFGAAPLMNIGAIRAIFMTATAPQDIDLLIVIGTR
jgi:hypothetical protein